jgi:acyl-CoA thioesterase FadM
MSAHPSELIETYRGAVYPWHCDHMGHMNVMWYVGKFDEATWNLFAAMGVTAAFLKENQRGMAAVQQNITYQRELLAGAGVSMDAQTRKSCPFPRDLLARAQALVRAYDVPL